MMGSLSGSYKFGGSLSSSSNLSPLAPPFMVNKLSSTNPSMNFPEIPAYGSVFDSPGSFSAVGHKFGATEPPVTTTCPTPSGAVYGYSESNNSDIYYGYSERHNNTGYDPFSYDQFPNNISNRNGGDGEVKPYYSPYVSAPPQVNGSGYDLLSSSSSDHYSPQVDHAHGASCGEEYKAKWGGSWSGLGIGEHGKWTDCAPSSGLKDFNLSNLSGNQSPFTADGSNKSHPFGDPINNTRPFGDASGKSNVLSEVGNKSNLKQGVSATQALDSHGVGSTISGNSFDIFGGTYHIGSFGIHTQAQNSPFKNLATTSIESPGFQRPVLESLTPFSGSQKANGSSAEDHHFPQKGYYMFGGSASSAGSTLSGIQVNSLSNEIPSNIKPSVGYDSSYHKKPQMPLGVDFQPGVAIRRPLISSKFGSSIQKEQAVNDTLAPKTIDSEVVEYSSEKHSSGSDLHNPGEDSPCWKGSSSTRFSPFSSVSEAAVANVFVNKEDGCKIRKLEEPQKKNPPVNFSDYVGPQNPTVPSNPKSYCIDLNIPEGLEFLDECHVLPKGSSVLKDQRTVSDSKLTYATKQICKENDVSSAVNISEASVAAKSKNCTSTGAHSSTGEDSLKHNQKNPKSRCDVNEVLKTMMKLSQLLHSYCLGNPTALTYQHMVTLRQIVSNLNATETTPSMIFSTQDSQVWKGFSVPEMLNYDEFVPPAGKQADPDEYFRGLSKSLDTIQDYNMTQGIKNILYVNLHKGIDEPEVSYKSLWLEAEAALCVMTTKARLNRMKIETEKNSQHEIKDKQNSSSPNISSVLPALVRESQKTSTTAQCNYAGEVPVSNSQHPCLSSIKASFPTESIKELNFPQFPYQILNSRGEDDSVVTQNNDEGKGCPNEELSSQDTSCIDTHLSGISNQAHEVETPVMAREINLCQKQSSGEDINDLSRIPAKNDVETSVMARYQILKCRLENSGSVHDVEESSQGEGYLVNGDPLSPNRQVVNSKLLDSVSSTSSVMDRFRVIQNRSSSLDTARKDPPQENRSEEDMTNIFGPYSSFRDEDEELSVSGEPSYKPKDMRTEIFEGWYGKDGSSSDWEHVSKEELRTKS